MHGFSVVPHVDFKAFLFTKYPMLIIRKINSINIVAINIVRIMLKITKFILLFSIQINASY